MANVGMFAGNFLNAFTQSKLAKEAKEDSKKERDAKMKLFELQLKREQAAATAAEQQTAARDKLFGVLGGGTPPSAGTPGINPTAPAPMGGAVPGAKPSLTQLLADPQTAMLFLQSGLLNTGDLLGQESKNSTRAMIEKLMGGTGGGGGGATGGMQLTGVKIGPDGQMMPDFGLPQVTSPQTINTPNGARLQTFDPRTGRMVADLGEPKPDTVLPEVAGRISGLVQAKEIGASMREKFIKPDGSIDRALVMTSFSKVPGTAGRTLRNDMGIAVDAVLRARTGAGVNKQEMQDVVNQFLPSPLDSDEGIQNKIARFQQFVSGALDVATLPPRLRKLIGEKSAPAGEQVIDFSELPP